MSIHAVGHTVASAGFSLAGIPSHEVSDRDASSMLAELTQRDDVTVLLIEQSVLDALEPSFQQELFRRAAPIIVPFPAPSWKEEAVAADRFILDLLQRAIGYRVRLR
jgi:vacuolar-type H+-ATPase subunit F/Vma7